MFLKQHDQSQKPNQWGGTGGYKTVQDGSASKIGEAAPIRGTCLTD